MFEPWLSERHIFLDLNSSDYKAVFQEMLGRVAGEYPQIEGDRLLQQLIQHECFGTCSLGFQAAFPHGYISGIEAPKVLFGISPKGVEFASRDGQLVHFIVMLLLPDCRDFEHVKQEIFRYAFRLFRDSYIRERLKSAQSVTAVYEALYPEEVCA